MTDREKREPAEALVKEPSCADERLHGDSHALAAGGLEGYSLDTLTVLFDD
jgi:hypothetical protein